MGTGTIILGVINLVFSIIGTTAFFAMLMGYSAGGSDSIRDALQVCGYAGGDAEKIDIRFIFYVTWEKNGHAVGDAQAFFEGILLAICVFYIITSFLLIQGARTS